MNRIVDRANHLDVTDEELDYLLDRQVILLCDRLGEYYPCSINETVYHVATEYADFDDPLAAMEEILSER